MINRRRALVDTGPVHAIKITLELALTLTLLWLGAIHPTPAYSQDDFTPLGDDGDKPREYLFGDLNGWREKLQEQGIDINALTVNDLAANVSGGRRQGAGLLGSFEPSIALDTEKLGWWKGGTFYLYMVGTYGMNPDYYVGDFQYTDNIDWTDGFRFNEAYYNQTFLDNKVSWNAGLVDYWSDFYRLRSSYNMLQSSFQIGIDVSQVPPSLYPITALGSRVNVAISDHVYAKAAVYDGVPGSPHDGDGSTQIVLKGSDGVFVGAETGWEAPEEEVAQKIAIGTWYRSTDFVDSSGVERNSNWGAYAIGEQQVLGEDEDPNQGLIMFLQAGYAQADRNIFSNYFGGGFAYQGLFPGRDEDSTFFGVASGRSGHRYRNAVDDSSLTETAIELSHRFQVTPYLAVQPDVQYVVDPGPSSIPDAWFVALRTEVVF